MIIHEITEECFKKYGKVIDSIDLTELVSTMQTVEIPADVVYEPSISALEKLKCSYRITTENIRGASYTDRLVHRQQS